jgi:predicted unusual protein kinase regulating ubiquinone biosynthesis (AarF/ABC1/UbiB family)
MSAKSPEARRVLRELDKELAAAGVQQGRNLVWSAQESTILGQISSILDRKHDFLAVYEQSDDTKLRLKLSAEVRLLEQAAARLVKEIKTDLPPALSYTSTKAKKAADTRWNRASG